MNRYNLLLMIEHLYCTNCENPVIVGHSSRDSWYGMCDCTTEQLPTVEPEIDMELKHADFTGEVDWPKESWEKRDNNPYSEVHK